MTALVRREHLPDATPGAVDRAMRLLGLAGVRRDKTYRTTIAAKDGTRSGDLVNQDFTADAPDRLWGTDFTYVRTWSGWAYVLHRRRGSPAGAWPGPPRPARTCPS